MTKSKDDNNKKQAAEARGEAKAYTVIGALGGAGWAASELALMPGVLELAAITTTDTIDNGIRSSNARTASTWSKVAFVAGAVAIGALIYAAFKHKDANDIEAKDDQAKDSWVQRHEREKFAAHQHNPYL
jgi:hypothetical protein